MITKPDGTTRVFQQSEKGLYFIDTSRAHLGTSLVTTVDENKTRYTNRDYSRAVLARKIQATISRPSTKSFINIVERNLLPNCPITRQDIMAAEHIFGPDVGSLKGKTVRRPSPQASVDYMPVPDPIVKQYQQVTICVDLMFVNRIPFLVSISRHLKFGTAEMLANQQEATLLKAIRQIRSVYQRRGFTVRTCLMDNQFNVLRHDLADMGITFNGVAQNEHVPEAERYIRTIKERARCIYNTLPFQRLPTRVIVEMIYASVFWLNTFPAGDGVSETLSPREIVLGLRIDYNRHCQIEFGSYVQVHEATDNTMRARTTGALALRPTGNAQGGHYFYSLSTGRRLNRNRWTALPMPNDVIERVHLLAQRGRCGAGLLFLGRDHEPLDSSLDYDHRR